MQFRRILLALVCLAALPAGCAKGKANGDGGDTGDDTGDGSGDGIDQPDASVVDRPDAAGHEDPPDAGDTGGGEVTITHSNSMALEAATGVSCQSGFGDKKNSWYRVFDLPAMGINGAVDVDQVTFGVQEASAGDGSQFVTVKLHRLQGDFVVANLTQLGTAKVSVPDETLTLVDLPLTATVPAGATLVAEVTVPNGEVRGDYFFPGANSAGQTGPTWVKSECGGPQPTDAADVGFPDFHLVLSVHGVEQ
jgi:hypothetical protein